MNVLDAEMRQKLLVVQRNEITEYLIYDRLSKSINDVHNKRILKYISRDELRHYNFWKTLTKENVKPSRFDIYKYVFLSKIFGITFAIKLMERGEEVAQSVYGEISKKIPAARKIMRDEDKHEKKLVDMIDEERLRYVGSMVLGLNDALVELTGALAGFTLALQNTKLIALVGLITGVAASMSMAASEYLSMKTEGGDKSPRKASIYTGSMYLFTVLLLISPFFVFTNMYFSIISTLVIAVLIILVFNFYISIAKDLPFRHRFFEMVLVSLGIAAITFVIGFAVRIVFGIDV